jgi:hypothetical protein
VPLDHAAAVAHRFDGRSDFHSEDGPPSHGEARLGRDVAS